MAKLKLTPEDKAWALAVKERDGWKCWVCGINHGDFKKNKKNKMVKKWMSAHHLLPRELKDYKYELMNGACLCDDHHMFCRIISAHNNPIAFALWMRKNKPEQLKWCEERCYAIQ